jgi:RNA polymerase sigma-70 factor (ECF subfamily)
MNPGEKESFIENIIDRKGEWLRMMAKTFATGESWQDLEQEMFMDLWKGLDSFRGRSSVDTWLYTTVRNTAVDFYRRENFLKKGDECLYPSPGFAEQDCDEIRIIEEFAKTLGDLDRQVFMMHLDDIGYRELSSETGVEEATLRKRLSRLKEKFKARYNGN